MAEKEFDLFTLPNGMRCVHRRPGRQGAQVAHLALTIGAGTRDEAATQHGVAHLVEHLLFKGTERRSAYRVNSLLENAGGELNAFTTKEETVVHATLLRSEFRKGVDLLSDMVFRSRFDAREIDKEREVVIDEINSYKDSPAELIFDDFEELLFAGSPLGRNILGTPRNLKRATQQQLKAYVAGHYRPDRIVFSASVEMPHSRFREICERYLAPFEAADGEGLTAERRVPERQPLFDVVRHKSTYQTHCLLGGYGYDLHDEQRLRLAFLINLLGGPASVSRLNMLLREKHALTYNVEAGYVPYSDSGIYTIYLGCERDKVEQSIELVRAELRRLRETKLTTVQLARAKRQFLGQWILSSENTENLMLGVAKSVLIYNGFEQAGEVEAKIGAITAEELLETANDIFNENNFYSLIYR
ncbi:pitrilysin family protein [uncultured Rikenella sp.]|uniref:M16 family metallopeptidase n=1 Tax=uncultured Rikenella sp. TaxID=368003 RepID=UPI00262F6E8E|nr:pitrilysin family protein [uncultured Rikenella sp.]